MNVKLSILLLACLLLCRPVCAGQVAVVQTFDSEQVADYALEYHLGDKKTRLYLSIDKDTQHSLLKYNPVAGQCRSFSQLAPALLALIQKADEITHGQMETFMTFEYMGCEEFVTRAVLAFHDDPVWKTYLSESKKRYVAPPYDHIRQRIIQADLFKDLDNLLGRLGYRVQFSSFEKLAVLKVKALRCYSSLEDDRVAMEDEIPVPLMLYFKIAAKPAKSQGASGNVKPKRDMPFADLIREHTGPGTGIDNVQRTRLSEFD